VSDDSKRILRPKTEHAKGVLRGLLRARKDAYRTAKMHGTKIWVMRDGKIVGLTP
jgi:hypothetical protein